MIHNNGILCISYKGPAIWGVCVHLVPGVTMHDLSWDQVRALTAVASAKAGVRVHEPIQNCLECRGKNRDKLIFFIVRVMRRFF